MKTPAWHRAVAHVLLTTFFTGIVGCGDATHEAATSSTTVPQAVAQAADTVPPPPPTTPPPPPTNPPPTPPSTLPEQPPEQLSKEELRDLVAPVALYPDVVLSSLLPATTYPEQVREARDYVGDAETVDSVPDDRNWDGSIVGLLQFPDVVRWLDENPAWTDQMGQAVTYQQGDVLQAIQDYRRAVQTAGNLQSNQYQKVRTGGSNQDIYIEPARPDVVYVPSYDPVVAVQPQPAPSPGINPWIAFGGGAIVGALGAYALYSIFDDDDHGDDYYYGGRYGGRRGRYIRGYDNYYYNRGRRPRPVAWAPRNRPYRRVDNWRGPRRLNYAAPNARPAKRAALRPPTKRPGAPPPLSTEVRPDGRGGKGNRQGQMRARDQRQEQKALQQEQKAVKQQQRQDQQRQERQQRQDRQVEKKQQQQQQRQGRQQRQQQQKMEQQQRQQQQRQEKQQRQQQQRIERQERQGTQRQERQQRQEPKQQQQRERRQEQQPGMQQGGGGGGGGNRDGGGGGGNKGGGGGGGGGGKKNNNKKKQGNE
jgi:hypothetical protein